MKEKIVLINGPFKPQGGEIQFRLPVSGYLRKLSALLFVAGLVMSCTKEVEVKMPEFQPQTAVNCLFTDGQPIKLQLSETREVFTSEPATTIDDAVVVIFKNGMLFDTLQLIGKGIYQSVALPESGNRYDLMVKTSKGDVLTSFDFLQSPNDYLQVAFWDSVRFTEDRIAISQAKIGLRDDGMGKNYYELMFEAHYINPMTMPPYGYTYKEAISPVIFRINSDPVLNNEGIADYSKTLLFTNELFSGQEVIIIADYYRYFTYQIDYNYDLVVKYRRVSENYYRYKKQLYQHLNGHAHETTFWETLGEPVQMGSNIKGGYGIFAAYSQVTDTLYKSNWR